MSEPTRWRDDPSIDPEIRSLLTSDHGPPAMKAKQRAAGAAFAAALLTNKAVAAGAAGGSLAWLTSSLTTKVVTSLIVVGGLTYGGFTWFREPETPITAPVSLTLPAASQLHAQPKAQPPPEPPRVPPPIRTAPTPASPSVETSPAPVHKKARVKTRQSPKPASAPPRDAAERIAAEARLLERARIALSSAPRRALLLVKQHAGEFPRGQLVDERQLIHIDALHRLGRKAAARTQARRLLARRGIYARRVRQILGYDVSAADPSEPEATK